MANKTSIVFFTNSPKEESLHKQLHTNKSHNLRIINSLYQRTKTVVNALPLPVIEINEDQQKGHNFGERLVYSIQSAFDNGAEHIIVVGNDCPFLHKRDFLQAKAALEAGQQVVGHSKDGGVYLIGLQRSAFDAEAFLQLAWTTNSLGEQLEQHLLQNGIVVQLTRKNDIDNAEVLAHLLGHYKHQAFAKIVSNLLKPFQKINFSIFQKNCFFYGNTYSLRGPPALSF